MRGVVEEKNNRIVEILLSSVRPFELMLGKLVGIALVGVTQFVVWVILSFLIVGGVRNHYSDFFSAIEQRSIQQLATKGEEATLQYEALQERGVSDELVEAMAGIDYSVLIGFFALYFLLGIEYTAPPNALTLTVPPMAPTTPLSTVGLGPPVMPALGGTTIIGSISNKALFPLAGA